MMNPLFLLFAMTMASSVMVNAEGGAMGPHGGSLFDEPLEKYSTGGDSMGRTNKYGMGGTGRMGGYGMRGNGMMTGKGNGGYGMGGNGMMTGKGNGGYGMGGKGKGGKTGAPPNSPSNAPQDTCGGVEPNCDDADSCTIDTALCQNQIWTCSNTPKECEPGSSCSLASGLCQSFDSLIPCIAVIDEDDGFGIPDQTTLWNQFRTAYPDRPFCLLIPNPESDVAIPTTFKSDALTVIASNIVRDFGDESLAMDWVTLCELNKYTSANSPWVGIFVDDSGSMYKSEVIASYNKLVSDLQAKSIGIKEVVDANENWILPFLTTLVPPTP